MNDRATAILNGILVLPNELVNDGIAVFRGDRIVDIGPRSEVKLPERTVEIDAHGGYIAPGFVDIHVHGGDGADFMDGTAEAVVKATRAHARHGTTSIFPTTTTGAPEELHAMLSACKSARDEWTIASGAHIAGVHFYGPYFAENKVGCHPPLGRRDPDAEEYLRAFEMGIVRIATCAAEIPGALDFYEASREHGHLVTCGHSDSTWTEMAAGFERGLRHVDHFWCAMSSVSSLRNRFGTPMQGSMAEFVLMNREMSTEVIADGCHLSPELLEFAFRIKGADRLCLVTDANRGLDMPPGDYKIGPQASGEIFHSDGKVGWMPNGGLCSTVVGMDVMTRNMKHMTSASLPEAFRMSTLTPAERAGVSDEVGSLENNKRANLLILNPDLELQRVFISGQEFLA